MLLGQVFERFHVALFPFCIALVAYNVLSAVKAALRSVQDISNTQHSQYTTKLGLCSAPETLILRNTYSG
jgi:hypothetical protein